VSTADDYINPFDDDEGIRSSAPVFVDNKVRVLDGKCTTCIFRPGNLMHLEPGVVKALVEGAVNDPTGGGHIACHDTLDLPAAAICRGFWDAHADKIALLQLAQRMGVVEYVPPPDSDEAPSQV
jgi:hypothetical protein